MKSFALLCFLLLASACVFVARAEDETPAVDASKVEEDQPEAAVEADEEKKESDEEDTESNEEETEGDEEETEGDEEETEADEEKTETDEENEDEESEDDEEETTDVANDESEKRGWVCKRYKKGYLNCKRCGCKRRCRLCARRVCRKRYRCGSRKVCKLVRRYRIVKYKFFLPYYRGYGRRFIWKTRKVPYKRFVCVSKPKWCPGRCYTRRYRCKCKRWCAYRKCFKPYYHFRG